MGFLDSITKGYFRKKPGKTPLGVGVSATMFPGGDGLFVREPYTGAWQDNKSLIGQSGMLASSAVFACVDLISSDVSKLRIKYVKLTTGVWLESPAPRYTVVLNKPNHYQTRQQFIKAWLSSKLLWGNAYILKTRNSMGAVIAMEVLNPRYVIPMVAPDDSVFYQVTMSPLQVSPLEAVVIPAADIIHDRGITAWHPLVGVSPLVACATSATMGSNIAVNSAAFFGNAARPSGVLTAPGALSQEQADKAKASWAAANSGTNTGNVAVLAGGLTYSSMTMTSTDAQLIEQLKWTVEDVARCYHVPLHKLGAETASRPAASAAIYEGMYYSDCLQAHIESIESLLDDGLGVPDGQGAEIDTGGLMRMDEAAMHASLSQAVGSGYMKPNEARAKTGLPPTDGGDSCYLQQQNYSLQALAKRDQQPAPSSTPVGGASAASPDDSEQGGDTTGGNSNV
ncbi:phage portal protein [Paraburkholderia fungorum]|uniref:phage portal protein n=1 Tax=Paraburkholderia fungorum TaxID=134537 RepID=UPI0038BA7563